MPGYAREQGALPLDLVTIVPPTTDRALFVGMTGSGKSTLARYILWHRKYRVVADYKGLIAWPEYRVFTRLKDLVGCNEPSLLYKPSYAESIDEDARGRFWEWVYRRGNCTVYNDETAATVDGNTYPFYLGACLMRGREHGIELWSGTQRPKEIPQIILSESENVYAFYLRLPQDRERVEGLTSIPRAKIEELKKREFLYARQGAEIVGPMCLRLPTP
jgi:hypothetical protein